jgi:acetyl-CoA acetyltransferase
MGIGRIPVVNVENACASASTAFNQACAMVSAGYYDCVLAQGVEKLYHADKRKTFAAFSGAVDVESLAASKGAGEKRSMFMDIYAMAAPMIAEPLTRPMCSPIGDGAAAVVIVSAVRAREAA